MVIFRKRDPRCSVFLKSVLSLICLFSLSALSPPPLLGLFHLQCFLYIDCCLVVLSGLGRGQESSVLSFAVAYCVYFALCNTFSALTFALGPRTPPAHLGSLNPVHRGERLLLAMASSAKLLLCVAAVQPRAREEKRTRSELERSEKGALTLSLAGRDEAWQVLDEGRESELAVLGRTAW